MSGQPKKAIRILKQQIKINPNNSVVYQLLSQAQFKAGFRSDGYQSCAKVLELYHNLDGAIQQIKLALGEPNNNPKSVAALHIKIHDLRMQKSR